MYMRISADNMYTACRQPCQWAGPASCGPTACPEHHACTGQLILYPKPFQSSLLQDTHVCSMQQAVPALQCLPPDCTTHWASNPTHRHSQSLCCHPSIHAASSLFHSHWQGLLHAAHHDRAQRAVAHGWNGLPHCHRALPVLAPHQMELCSGPDGRVVSLVAVVAVHLRQRRGS